MQRGLLVVLILLAAATVIPSRSAVAVEGDVVFKRKDSEGGTPPATFPHWIHRIRYKCYACHPDLFAMKAGSTTVTMEAMLEGKFCGACHNGKIAWGVAFDTCNRCHVEK